MTPEEILAALAEPFEAGEVKFRPTNVRGNRAMALHYVDARVIQDRLDEVLGVAGWQDEYECLPDGSVVCRLRCRIGNDWIQKMDVGSPSEQPDEGDRRKAAFSDALKRAAVKFGIGRYLYRLPSQWVDYDPQKKQFVRTPSLPGPARKAAPASPPPVKAGPAAGTGPTHPPGNGKRPPADGAELEADLRKGEAKMVELGWCKQGELLSHIQKTGMRRKYPAEIVRWTGEAITWAVEEAKRFKEARKAAAAKVSPKTLGDLKQACLNLGLDADDQAALLAKYDVDHGEKLTEAQGQEMLKDLGQRLRAKQEAERDAAEADGIV